jgi:hypothetical protein
MKTQSKVLKWSVIIGIIIVVNLFVNYSISLVYKSPKFEAYCPMEQVIEPVSTQVECVDRGGQWNGNIYPAKPVVGETAPAGYCDLQYSCRQNYDSAQDIYNRNIFIALVVLGALMVLIGNYFKDNEVIENGLALGGVLSFLIASMRYWSSASDLIHVIILAIALGILFYVALKKFKRII